MGAEVEGCVTEINGLVVVMGLPGPRLSPMADEDDDVDDGDDKADKAALAPSGAASPQSVVRRSMPKDADAVGKAASG